MPMTKGRMHWSIGIFINEVDGKGNLNLFKVSYNLKCVGLTG